MGREFEYGTQETCDEAVLIKMAPIGGRPEKVRDSMFSIGEMHF
jgi:hypothetical protein